MKIILYILLVLSTPYSLHCMLTTETTKLENLGFDTIPNGIKISSGIFALNYQTKLRSLKAKGLVVFSCNLNNYEGEIHRLVVYKESQRQGFGTKLMRHAIQTLDTFGCKEITWTAAPSEPDKLPELIKFYERLGGEVKFQNGSFAIQL